MEFTPVPTVIRDGEKWLILSSLTNRGTLRAAKIIKNKTRPLDWDSHHCDEAHAKSSIRYCPKGWIA